MTVENFPQGGLFHGALPPVQAVATPGERTNRGFGKYGRRTGRPIQTHGPGQRLESQAVGQTGISGPGRAGSPVPHTQKRPRLHAASSFGNPCSRANRSFAANSGPEIRFSGACTSEFPFPSFPVACDARFSIPFVTRGEAPLINFSSRRELDIWGAWFSGHLNARFSNPLNAWFSEHLESTKRKYPACAASPCLSCFVGAI